MLKFATFLVVIKLAVCFANDLTDDNNIANNYIINDENVANVFRDDDNEQDELRQLKEQIRSQLDKLEAQEMDKRNELANQFTITVDNGFRVYFDGVEQLAKLNANDWTKTDTYDIPPSTQVIGVKGSDWGVIAGILASTSDGSVLTNGRWKCSNDVHYNWANANYDDSSWPHAVEIGGNGVQPWNRISTISSQAKWIWTTGYQSGKPGYDETVYCRVRITQPLPPSCKQIKAANTNAPSDEYNIETKSGRLIKVYCEMGLNGGGYTFVSPPELAKLSDSDVQFLFSDKTSFLMRSRNTDGTQRYGVLQQLPQYASVQLNLGLNQNTGYNTPVNKGVVGLPYLYFGFLPIANAANNNQQGIKVNDVSVTFSNCDRNSNSYISLFPNFKEITPSNVAASTNYPFCDQIFRSLKINPSTRNMPVEYFLLAELHFGGCGCYTSTDRYLGKGILSTSIGFR